MPYTLLKEKEKELRLMGMSGSQARLLSLTSRMHDVELKAQILQNKKLSLATQKDEVYQEYCDALDASYIKVAFKDDELNISYIDANFQSLCEYNEYRRKSYVLKNNENGFIIVNDKVKEKYDGFKHDKFAFAYAMLGYEVEFGWQQDYNDSFRTMGAEIGIGTAQEAWEQAGFKYADDATNSLYMTDCEADVYEKYIANNPYSTLEALYKNITSAKDKEEQKTALKNFREYLYQKDVCGPDIYKRTNINKNGTEDLDWEEIQPDKEWFDVENEFKFYLQLWEAINEAGGCETIDPQFERGKDGNQWFNGSVEAGKVSILVWDEEATGYNRWETTTVATSINANYLLEEPDEDAIKRAEVKYDHDLDLINDKDAKFDMELSKLETERTAIKTEMDSIDKVKQDNIDRTFKVFS